MEQLHNHIAYYQALAEGRTDVDTWGRTQWRHTPSLLTRIDIAYPHGKTHWSQGVFVGKHYISSQVCPYEIGA